MKDVERLNKRKIITKILNSCICKKIEMVILNKKRKKSSNMSLFNKQCANDDDNHKI